MSTTTKTFKLFGITLWSYTVVTQIDEEAIYLRLSERFSKEMSDALARVK